MYDVAVIGGGAAGMMAAITASEEGKKVILLEKNDAVGKKLSATGNGRCNFTNQSANDVKHYHGAEKSWIGEALARFSVEDALSFFEKIGAAPVLEEQGKYFPRCGQASAVCELLERKMKALSVQIDSRCQVENICFHAAHAEIVCEQENVPAKHVILATGGLAAPQTGSDGFGYSIAASVGHTILPCMPVIVQMVTEKGFRKRLDGLRIKGDAVLVVGDSPVRKESGDILFFDYGLSGPAVFQLSIPAQYAIKDGKSAYIELDLLPDYDEHRLYNEIRWRFGQPELTVSDCLVGLLHKKLIGAVLEAAGISEKEEAWSVSEPGSRAVCKTIKHWRHKVTQAKNWENAQATAGGISAAEVEAGTLKSKLQSKLSFCGEILDVVGDCGGFNLQWAWTSGFCTAKGI